jgi:hypothetical protein
VSGELGEEGTGEMNKSVPTLLGIIIILLVVVLAVLVVNYKVTKGLGEGQTVTGTVGGQVITGTEAPKENIEGSTVLGSRQPEPVEPTQVSPEQQQRMTENREKMEERREEGAPGRKAPGGGPQ